MTMESIQNAAVSYQGSGVSVDKAQSVAQATVQMPERAVPVGQQNQKAANDSDKAADRNATSEKVSDSSLKRQLRISTVNRLIQRRFSDIMRGRTASRSRS